MNDVLLLLGWNLAITAMLAVGVWCLAWLPALRRRPALRHGLWLLVLLKLVVPPLVPVPVLPAGAAPVSADRALDPVTAADPRQASRGASDVGQRAMRNQSAETINSAPRDLPAGQVAETSGVGWREILLVLAGISLTVSVALWLAALGQLRRVRRALKNGPLQSGRVAKLLEEAARGFGLRRVPRLFLADAPVTPMLWADRGRPVIVLPEQLVGLVDDDQLRSILGHELAHCVRRDHLANLLAFGVVSLFWWNPVAWLAWGELTSAAEAACDALALERLAGSRKSYAETLLVVIDFMSRAHSPDLAIGVGFGRSRSLQARFAMLARRGVRPGVSWTGWGVIALGAVALTLLPAQAADQPKAALTSAAEPPVAKIDLPPARPAPPPADAQPAQRVEGSVVDSDGKAVAGAEVWLVTYWSFDPMQPLTLAGRADAAGHFGFSVPEAWLEAEHILEAYACAPGRAVGLKLARIPEDEKIPGEPLTVELSPASDLSVVVTLPDGKPAVGAKVGPVYYRYEGAMVAEVPWAVAEKIGGVTNHQGRAKLPALMRDRGHLTAVVLQHYGRQLFDLQESGRRQNDRFSSTVVGEPELRLLPAGRIEGRLIADQPGLVSGIPIEIATVAEWENHGATADELTGYGRAEITTDAQGRFVIPEMPEGKVHVTINVDRQLPAGPRIPDLKLTGGETLKLEIPWEKRIRVHGMVRVKDGGEPLEARVSLEYGPQQVEQVTTDEKGNYSALVLPGSVRLFAEIGKEQEIDGNTSRFGRVGDVDYVDAEGPRGKTCAVPKGVADFELPPIEAVPAFQVTGTLVDAQGKRLADAEIRGTAGRMISDRRSSSDEGEFWLGWFPVGTTFDSFTIRSGGERFDGQAVAIDPLIVRVQPKAAKREGNR